MTKKTKCLKMTVAVLSLVLVMCLSVAGTLAYLQVKTEPVVNTFAPSNIGLTLVETATEGGSTTANTYKMVPGVDIAKDPKVTVTADIDCYVFVEVVESDNFDDYMTYAIASNWKLLNTTTGKKTEITDQTELNGTYVLVHEVLADEAKDSEAFYVLAGKGDAELKNGYVTVKPDVSKDKMKDFYGADGITVEADAVLPKLTFTAYAIQKEGFTNPALAWAEAKEQQNANG